MTKHEWKLYKARFDYAWRYFEFHAKQRTTMFNFFILFSGVLMNACFRLLVGGYILFLGLTCAIGGGITIFFVFLERRNEELVHIAEDILRSLENEVLFKDYRRTIKWPKQRDWFGNMIESDHERRLGIFIRQDDDESCSKKSKYLHGKWLPIIQLSILAVYLILFWYSLYLIQCEHVRPLWYNFPA